MKSNIENSAAGERFGFRSLETTHGAVGLLGKELGGLYRERVGGGKSYCNHTCCLDSEACFQMFKLFILVQMLICFSEVLPFLLSKPAYVASSFHFFILYSAEPMTLHLE